MNKRKILFYTCMWLSILFFFFCSLWSHGTLFLRSFFVGDVPYCIEDTYMDFFNSIMYGLQPYEAGVIYPPLTNLFYFVAHAMIPRDIFMQGAKVIRDAQSGRMLIMIYTMASLFLLHFALAKLQKDRSENEKFLFFITVLFSAPILFAIERGNIILLALAFMILYLAYYESDNTLLRHIAYISLAIAASIKIYPALLGLLLVRDKRWKDALICFIYGVLVFFLPFIFLGGINSIVMMVQNLTYFSGIIGNYFGNGWRLGIAAICDDFSIWLTGEIGALSILAAILKALGFTVTSRVAAE